MKYSLVYSCPWCGKGEVLANGRAPVSISVRCPRCPHIFYVDLYRGRTERGQAYKRVGRKK